METMTKQSRVINVIDRTANRSNIELTDNIKNDLGFDSLDFIEMIVNLEKEFEVFITDEEAEEWKTVGDVINFIEKEIK